MASLVLFQDHNLQFGPSTFTGGNYSSSSAGSPGIIVLKIEPKLDLLDKFAQEDLQTPASFSNPSLTSNSVFNLAPPRQSDAGYGSNFPSDDNVYSEFHRILELFCTAFAKRMQRYSDVEVFEDTDSRAIVPLNNDRQLSTVVIARRKYQQSTAFVRADQRYFWDVVRKTRMLYDYIRLLAPLEDERNQQYGHYKKTRWDLKAAQLMRERGLWLNRDKRIVGSIPSVYGGDLFFFRMELCVVGLHGQVQAGIDYVSTSHSSNGEPIVTSMIVSGGYKDYMDSRDVIIYNGHGWQDKNSHQCVSQKIEGGNLALEKSMY